MAEFLRSSSETPRKEVRFLSPRVACNQTIVLVKTSNRLPASCCDSPTARRKEQSEIKDRTDNADASKLVRGIYTMMTVGSRREQKWVGRLRMSSGWSMMSDDTVMTMRSWKGRLLVGLLTMGGGKLVMTDVPR